MSNGLVVIAATVASAVPGGTAAPLRARYAATLLMEQEGVRRTLTTVTGTKLVVIA
jgi:hypothetical protein